MPARLDVELVSRGLARSRTMARALIDAGRVRLDGDTAERASAPAHAQSVITVTPGSRPDYASRAGHKLAGALDAFAADPTGGPKVAGARVLDAGASTGGFTDVLLRRGAREVIAVDVGTDQLLLELRNDPRVTVVDGMNVRELRPADVAPAPTLAVGDLSFISLTLVLEPLQRCLTPDAELVLLIKPQFEVGRDRLGSGGVVSRDRDRIDAVAHVLDHAATLGMATHSVVASELPGPHGNVEYVAWFRQGGPVTTHDDHARRAHAAVTAGPQGRGTT